MTSYQLTAEGYVVRDGDTKVPTVDTPDFPNTNPDYFEYRAWLAAGGVPLPAALRPAAEIAAGLRQALAAEYRRRILVIAAGYPLSERESWSVQTEEAKAILLNSEAVTPWIDAASISRGIDRLLLAQRIIKKDSDYRALHGKLTGIKQKIEDEIDEAGSDIEKLQTIDVKIRWSEITETI